MTFLYGDATPSPLKENIIELLPELLEFSVKLLQADAHLQECGARAVAAQDAAQTEGTRLEALAQLVAETLAPMRADGPSGRCAAAIGAAGAKLVDAEVAHVRAGLQGELSNLEAKQAEDRAACLGALEALLRTRDLPDMVSDIRIVQQGGARYQARLLGRTPWGLEVEIDLEVPAAHLFSHMVRIDKIVDRLEVQAPEEGGWLRKEVKLRPQRLDKEYLAEAFIGASEATLRLRASAEGNGAGYDIAISRSAAKVRMVRVGEGELPPFELAEVDAERLTVLRDKLAALADELKPHRRALIEARFAETSLRNLGSPRLVVESLVAATAPVVQEIARHSPANELVLKRLLGDGKREEIFIAKDQLRRVIEPLPPSLRMVFAPLGIVDGTPPPPPAPPEKPPLEVTPSLEIEVSKA